MRLLRLAASSRSDWCSLRLRQLKHSHSGPQTRPLTKHEHLRRRHRDFAHLQRAGTFVEPVLGSSTQRSIELLTRITRTTRVIRESFDEYDAKIPYPHNDVNGGISNAAFRRFLRQYDAMWINFFKMNLFKAALTPELRSVVAQQEQDTITIKKMYQVATTAQRELKGKGPALVNEVREEESMAVSTASIYGGSMTFKKML